MGDGGCSIIVVLEFSPGTVRLLFSGKWARGGIPQETLLGKLRRVWMTCSVKLEKSYKSTRCPPSSVLRAQRLSHSFLSPTTRTPTPSLIGLACLCLLTSTIPETT
jgi:hypothetical protein